MHNPNPPIELGTRPPRPYEALNPLQNPQHHNYQPQQDEDDDDQQPQNHPQQPQIPQEQPQNSWLEAIRSFLLSKFSCLDKLTALKIAMGLILLCLIIELVVFSVFTYYLIEDNSETAESLSQSLRSVAANLNTDPIMDLQIIDKASTCPSGFEPLKLGTWPGTIAGCLYKDGELVESNCEAANAKLDRASGTGEIDIPETKPIEMSVWDDSVFCAKRAVLGTDYIKKAECPIGYQECYPAACFSGKCPIIKLEINSRQINKNKFNTVEGKYLVITQTQGFPLINIQMTPNDIPCFKQGLYPKSTSDTSYKLSAIKENGCGKYGLDSSFTTRLDSHSAFDSYIQNSFPDSVMNLPDLAENAKETVSVLSWTARMRTVVNDACLSLDEKSIQNSWWIIQVIYNLIPPTWAIHSLQLLIFFVLSVCLRFNIKTQFEKAACSFIEISSLLVLVWHVFRTAQLYVGYSRYQVLMAIKEPLERFYMLGCSTESQVNMAVSEYLKVLRMGEICCWGFLAIYVSSTVYSLICICYSIVTRKSPLKSWRRG